MDASVTALRDELSRLTGPARIPALVRLGQHLVNGYWRAGPGRPGSLAGLTAAIDVLDEAYRLLGPADPARGQVAGYLGYLLAARHSAHGSGNGDRDTGLRVLNEALGGPGLPPVQEMMIRLSLGQLHLSRVLDAMNPAAARGGFAGGLSPSLRTDADEAVRRFREVVDGPQAGREVTAAARTMLTLAEAMRSMLGGNLGSVDLGALMRTMGQLQTMMPNGGGAGIGSLPPQFWNLEKISDPLDYPVASMRGDARSEPTIPPRPRTAPAQPTADAGAARRSARVRLTAMAGEAEVWDQARKLLRAGPDRLAATDLDAFVGAASNAVDAADGDASVEAGLDLLLSAVGLRLKEQRDGSGWGDDEDADTGPSPLVRQRMRAASQRIPASHPAAAVVAEALDALRGPAFDEPFEPAEVAAALREIGAGALVYPRDDGYLCLDAATGHLDICPELPTAEPPRILAAGDVPIEHPDVTHVASAAELLRLATRPLRPVGEDPVFVVNPRGDRDELMVDVMALRMLLYPVSACLGRALEPADAPGTEADLLVRLPAASLVHLACGLDEHAPALLLAGGDELATLPEVRPGGLVILGTPDPAGLTGRFLDAGFSGVVGWLRPVPPRFAALALFVVHLMLVERRLPPAEAVIATRRWLRDPGREPLPLIPAAHLHTVTAMDLTQPDLWAALTYRGR